MQQDFERRGDRGRGDPDRGGFTQHGDDRDYERIYDNYGEGSSEYDPRRGRASDRERYERQPRQDRYADEMRGGFQGNQDRGEQRRIEQERFERAGFEQGCSPRQGSSGPREYDQRGYDPRGYDQRGYDQQQRGSGRSGSPYDQGEISSWYGGDSGMGDSGSSLGGGQQGTGQSTLGQQSRGPAGQHDAGWRGRSQPQASSQYSQQSHDQNQYRDRFSGNAGGGNWSGSSQGSGWGQDMHGTSSDPRSIEGPFTGRGPRGYRRSDERILEDVCELLTRHGDIDASQMEVDVHNGVVSLHGVADSGRVRRLTEEIVEDITGVRDVRNDLRVNQRTGYAESMPSDQAQSSQSRSEMGRSETGRSSDWERGEAGRRETSQGRETSQSREVSQTGSRQAGSIDTSTPAYGTGVANTSGAVQTGAQTQHAQAGGSQIGSRFTIREGMDVAGSDGVIVGQVKETRGTDFLVDRPMQRDVYVPFSAVQTVDGDRVMLATVARDVDNQNWPTPDLAGASQQRPSGGG